MEASMKDLIARPRYLFLLFAAGALALALAAPACGDDLPSDTTSTSGSGVFYWSESQYPGGSLSGRYTGYVRRFSAGTA